jgi:hypothetical protein
LTYLIQHSRTREYFLKGTWTPDSGWAEQFSDLAKAITACLRHDLRDVELVLQFGLEIGRTYSLQLPLPDKLLFGREAGRLFSSNNRCSASSLEI